MPFMYIVSAVFFFFSLCQFKTVLILKAIEIFVFTVHICYITIYCTEVVKLNQVYRC